MALSVALVHHPVYDKHKRVVATALTNLDLHDIARSSRTYGVETFFIVHPVAAQRELAARIAGHWTGEAGAEKNDFRRQAITLLESMGISVEFSHHEGAPGQNEIDLRYADALSTADNIMTFRTVIKEVALEQGIFASFMPKPFAQHPGSGMHTHMSLFDGDSNAFHEPGAPGLHPIASSAACRCDGLARVITSDSYSFVSGAHTVVSR